MSETPANYDAGPLGRRDEFMYFVQHGRDGDFQIDVSDELRQCIEHAIRTGQTSTLKIELTVKPYGRQVQITDSLAAKRPRAPTLPTLMFHSERTGLSRQDPEQSKLPLKDVNGDPVDFDTLRRV